MSSFSGLQILPQPRKAHNCSKSSFSGLRTEFYKQPMTDPTTAPKNTQSLQKLVFGAVDGIPQAANDRSYHSPEKHTIAAKARFGLWTEFHKQPMTDPTTAPKSTQLLQKIVFGAVDGILQAANDRSHHSPEKQRIASKARFRGCGWNSTSSQWQILPQPRKAHNCSKSSFSGLWTEFHKQPMTDPATAPKSKQLLQKLIFGAVDGIPQAAKDRSYHSPEKHIIAPKALFRGCGRNSTSSQWQILPQPRKAHNCSKSSFSGLWTEFHKQPMTDPTTAPKSTQLLQKLVWGLSMDGIPQAANDTFWLANVLRATTACDCSSLVWPAGSAPAALASLLFDPPEPQIIEKTQWIATFLPFRASPSSLFLLFLFYSSPFWSFSSLCLCPALLFICPHCRKFDF